MNPRALYDANDVAWLTRPDPAVEGPWVERKRSVKARALAQAISGFANGLPPGGLFVVGADKDGALPGVAEQEAVKLLEAVRAFVEGGWEHRLVPLPGGEVLLYLYVPFSRDRCVRLSDGCAFRRVGASTVELKPEQIVELRYDRGEVAFEDEAAAPFAEDLIDPELAHTFLEQRRAKNGLTLPLGPREALRDRLYLVTRDGTEHLTHAGLVLVGREPRRWLPGARLRLLRFEGTEERVGKQRNVVKDRWFDGAVPRIVTSFGDFMATQVREFDYLRPDGRFANEPEYPRVAWHEAVVNALVHRSYSLRNAWVTVKMFDDRVEVLSPGGFPGEVRPTAEGIIPESYPRNAHLADGLWYFELVRMAHEGTRRMHDEMLAVGLPPPEIREAHDGQYVRVVLRNDIERRRARLGSGEASAAWHEIAGMLDDDLALVRGRALQRWRALVDRGAPPTGEVLDAALRLVRNREASDEQVEAVLELVASRRMPGEHAVRLAELIVSGDLGRHDIFARRAPGVLSASEPALETCLRALEREADGLSTHAVEVVFSALHDRVMRDPLPSREWLDRVVRACERAPHRGSDRARHLYRTITGRSLEA